MTYQLGDVLARSDETERALPYPKAAARYAPRGPRANAELRSALFALGRPADAVPYLEAGVDADGKISISSRSVSPDRPQRGGGPRAPSVQPADEGAARSRYGIGTGKSAPR